MRWKPLSFLGGVETPDSITLRLLRHLRLMTLLPLFLKWNELLSLLPQIGLTLPRKSARHGTHWINCIFVSKVKNKSIRKVDITSKINKTGL